MQGCAPIATRIISFRGAALKSVAQSYCWKANVLEAGGCGEPCENKSFCVPASLCTECTLNLRVTALWAGSELSPWHCLCHTGTGVSLCLQHPTGQPPWPASFQGLAQPLPTPRTTSDSVWGSQQGTAVEYMLCDFNIKLERMLWR